MGQVKTSILKSGMMVASALVHTTTEVTSAETHSGSWSEALHGDNVNFSFKTLPEKCLIALILFFYDVGF